MLLSVFAAQKTLAVVRAWHGALQSGSRPGFASRKILRLRHELWGALSGSDIALGAAIGANLKLPHPNGVVVHQNSVIGDDCMIMQQVTIGQRADGAAPVIGSGVYIGAGAKVLGGVKIGDRAAVGANAVVLADVPPGATAVGIPARIVKEGSNG